MAVHIFRREATYYWRRRTPIALAKVCRHKHVFMSLRTTSLPRARRLASKLDAIIEDAAMLAEEANFDLSQAQLDGMLRSVVTAHLGKLERSAAAAKSFQGFDAAEAVADDKRALWTYRLLVPKSIKPTGNRQVGAVPPAQRMIVGRAGRSLTTVGSLGTNVPDETSPGLPGL